MIISIVLIVIVIAVLAAAVYDRYRKNHAKHKFVVTLKPGETIHTATRIQGISISMVSTECVSWHTLAGFPTTDFPETKSIGSTRMGPVYLKRCRVHAFTNISNNKAEVEISWIGPPIGFSEKRVYPKNARSQFN